MPKDHLVDTASPISVKSCPRKSMMSSLVIIQADRVSETRLNKKNLMEGPVFFIGRISYSQQL